MNNRFFPPNTFPAQPAPPRRATDGIQVAAAVVATEDGPMHVPALEPRDEVVFLLTAAAEVEHALMAQYLYAAYSVRVMEGGDFRVKQIQDLLLQIAREEMGHLITVQNLLHALGGPLNLNREHSPYASEVYPFRFKLEPVNLHSLAKYVVAESPAKLPDTFPEADVALYATIQEQARQSNDARPVQHVGPIFARLEKLLSENVDGVKEEDFRLNSAAFQGRFEDWGFSPGKLDDPTIPDRDDRLPLGEELVVETIAGADAAQARAAAGAAVKKIGEQGEGFDLPPAQPGMTESHFERFFDLYKRFKTLSEAGVQITWPVAENPNTTSAPKETPNMMRMVEMVEEAHAAKGRITAERPRNWAHLFNLRYRMLLAHLSHFLRLDTPVYEKEPGGKQGDRTARGLLLVWTFNEMRRLKKIAGKLVQLPKDAPSGGVNAGPPFELPYTLNLPEREADRWRAHLSVSRAAVRLVREQLQPGNSTDAADEFLADLVRMDEEAQAIMQSLAQGGGIPEGALPADFQKTVHILEEAIRGFTIGGPHLHFWAEKDRDAFLRTPFPAPLAPGQGGEEFDFNPVTSPLIRRVEHADPERRMPLYRPPIPEERVGFIRDWITQRCPHNAMVGIARERDPAPESPAAEPPLPEEALSFQTHIRPLFRESPDRAAMLNFGLDLHDYDQVHASADRILGVLADGSMPCDGAWPPERIEMFRQWIAQGKQP